MHVRRYYRVLKKSFETQFFFPFCFIFLVSHLEFFIFFFFFSFRRPDVYTLPSRLPFFFFFVFS